MSNWARRMHRRAATLSSVVTSCGHPNSLPYPRRLEKVKFGVPLHEVCKDDIPGPLLVLILKLNKEAPLRRDVFRAPGHQGAMKKLIHFLQTGRLVNVDNYSVYTIASVLKKFLRKIPGGVFGREGEMKLFACVDLPEERQVEEIRRLLMSLPVCTQRFLVLLFGTFRVMASNADKSGTGMTSEALGVSVAPSFFHSCVSDGKTATMEDVQRFKVATRIMRQLIEQFSAGDLFGHDNYEYYARVTGRVLRVKDEWICSFRDPPPPRHRCDQEAYARQLSLEAEKTWLQCESDRWGNKFNLESLSKSEECQSMPALMGVVGGGTVGTVLGLGIIPEHSLLDSCTRLSISLEESVFKISVSSSSQSSRSNSSPQMTLEELRAINKYAEATKSLSYLPQVHERQRSRMRARSEWFLQPAPSLETTRPRAGGERRSSRRRSRRSRMCGGCAACRNIAHSDTEIPITVQSRKVTA
ncbi:uncharacterized protein LOC113239318 isoform X2 [Hyposmocoma kahamanoa]|uniref:uncharacterized protein LOC113239318 isoform X2 n=1 Tax=Hyposmocoma kahamanoa TaxID=1477025 RepID=UPI000E6D991F|nr:uncharacterized protein LOC113239318 isoform X2 [Hyposmocoma kahamanoa]